MPTSFRAFAVILPGKIETERAAPDLAVDDLEATLRARDAWAAPLRAAALIVPAALDPGGIGTEERNVLLNSRHPSAATWRSVETSFRVDPRLRRVGNSG